MARREDRFVVGDGVQADVGCDVYLGIAEVGSGEIGTSYLAAIYLCTAIWAISASYYMCHPKTENTNQLLPFHFFRIFALSKQKKDNR